MATTRRTLHIWTKIQIILLNHVFPCWISKQIPKSYTLKEKEKWPSQIERSESVFIDFMGDCCHH